jgi:hypothetical protein
VDYEVAKANGETPQIVFKIFFPPVAEGEPERCAKDKTYLRNLNQIAP